jgi:hypothetical protein
MKHVFHVYTLPAYAVAALWMALGFAWLARRYALRARVATGSVAALLALVLAWGARGNLLADYDWAARYAQTVLKILPADAVVFVQGDPDLGPIGYFHMIEGQRPDITLFQSKGLLLGNRLFHPLRTVDQAGIDGRIRKLVDSHTGPVVFTLDSYTVYARLDRWLYVQVDKSSTDPARVTVDIPEEAQRFFEESLATVQDGNAWAAFFQGELRRRYGILLGQGLPRGRSPDARAQRHLELLSKDYYGALGLAEGLLANREGYPPAVVSGLLETVRSQMPSDATKFHLSRFFYLRGLMRIGLNDRAGAIADLDTALSAWPVADNPALKPLGDLYTAANDTRALDAMQDRIRRRKR